MQVPLVISVFIGIWLLFKRRTMNRTLYVTIFIVLVLFTPIVFVPKDGSGSYTLRALMYSYSRIYHGFDLYTKTYTGPLETTFRIFPFNFIQ